MTVLSGEGHCEGLAATRCPIGEVPRGVNGGRTKCAKTGRSYIQAERGRGGPGSRMAHPDAFRSALPPILAHVGYGLVMARSEPNEQYVYTMYRVDKFYGPDRQVLSNISLSFLPGAKIGVLGPTVPAIDAASHHGRARGSSRPRCRGSSGRA